VNTDEGFREIQLNGKQLVFLFMAATVVSVVIFLCGVLVGRGVRSERLSSVDTSAAAIAPDPTATPPPAPSTTPPQAVGEPPAPADETLSYYDRLQKNDTPPEKLKSPNPTPAPERSSPSATPSAQNNTRDLTSTSSEPPGPGFAVQVAAYRDRKEADTLVKKLIGKGYPAFVMAPVKGAPMPVYRVRVGKYKDHREADAVSNRLKTEEQFNPWIAR